RGPSRLHAEGLQPDGAGSGDHGYRRLSGLLLRRFQWTTDRIRPGDLHEPAEVGGDPGSAWLGLLPELSDQHHERVGCAGDVLGLCGAGRPVPILDLPDLYGTERGPDLLRDRSRLRWPVALRLHDEA